MAGLQITTAPTTEPVTLQEAKEYLRLGDSTDERVLQNFIENQWGSLLSSQLRCLQ